MTTNDTAAGLIESFADFAKQKNIDRPTMIRILEDVFRNMIRKKYETDDNFDIIINAERRFGNLAFP
jgi:N utilization substance protein A